MKTERESRSTVIHFRVGPDEKRLIKRAATRQFDYAGNYIRRVVLMAAERDGGRADNANRTEVFNDN